MNFRMQEGEQIIKQGKANRSKLLVAQGGELTLTNKRLIFVSHGMNIGEGTISIDIDEIMTYGKAFTFSIWFPLPIPNAFKVVLRNGSMYKFTVSGRGKWLNEVGGLINSL